MEKLKDRTPTNHGLRMGEQPQDHTVFLELLLSPLSPANKQEIGFQSFGLTRKGSRFKTMVEQRCELSWLSQSKLQSTSHRTQHQHSKLMHAHDRQPMTVTLTWPTGTHSAIRSANTECVGRNSVWNACAFTKTEGGDSELP